MSHVAHLKVGWKWSPKKTFQFQLPLLPHLLPGSLVITWISSLFTFSCTKNTPPLMSFLKHLTCTLIIKETLTHHPHCLPIFLIRKNSYVFKTKEKLWRKIDIVNSGHLTFESVNMPLGSITTVPLFRERSPRSSLKGRAVRVRILSLVLANQITTHRFLSGINYLVSSDCGAGWRTMWNW